MTHMAHNLSAPGLDGFKPLAELLPALYKGLVQLAAARVAYDKPGQSPQAQPQAAEPLGTSSPQRRLMKGRDK